MRRLATHCTKTNKKNRLKDWIKKQWNISQIHVHTGSQYVPTLQKMKLASSRSPWSFRSLRLCKESVLCLDLPEMTKPRKGGVRRISTIHSAGKDLSAAWLDKNLACIGERPISFFRLYTQCKKHAAYVSETMQHGCALIIVYVALCCKQCVKAKSTLYTIVVLYLLMFKIKKKNFKNLIQMRTVASAYDVLQEKQYRRPLTCLSCCFSPVSWGFWVLLLLFLWVRNLQCREFVL